MVSKADSVMSFTKLSRIFEVALKERPHFVNILNRLEILRLRALLIKLDYFDMAVHFTQHMLRLVNYFV